MSAMAMEIRAVFFYKDDVYLFKITELQLSDGTALYSVATIGESDSSHFHICQVDHDSWEIMEQESTPDVFLRRQLLLNKVICAQRSGLRQEATIAA